MPRLPICMLCFAIGIAFTFGPTDTAAQVVKPGQPKPNDPKAKVPDPKTKTPVKPPVTTPKPPVKPVEPEPSAPPPAEESTGLPSPLRLAQGLRDQGLADLAMQYLDGLDPKSLTDADRSAIPLEKAKTKLVMANEETEEAAKAALFAQVKTELNSFLKTPANAKHPRRAEANLSLARLTSLEAKALLGRAKRNRDKAQQKSEKNAAKALFTEASTQYAAAASEMASMLGSMPDSVLKRAMQREKSQAELDSAINLFELYDTFPSDEDATAADRQARSATLTQATRAFDTLTKGPTNNPNYWIAKAWMAECDTIQQKPEAKAAIDEINRYPGTAAEAGRRLTRYFEVKHVFDAAGTDAKSLGEVQTAARNWLGKYDISRKPTPESVHVKFMLARSLEAEARVAMAGRAPKGTAPKIIDPNPTERTKLNQAEKFYRDVASTENDFTDQASDNRLRVVRLLIGESIKAPKEYVKYEDAHMASLVQHSKIRDSQKGGNADKDALKASQDRLIELLERARQLATPADSHTDVINDQINLAVMYLTTGRPYEAAVLGEYIAKQPKPVSGRSSVAGELAMGAYLAAAQKAPEGDEGESIRKGDRQRAIQIAKFVEEKFPTDAATDSVRFKLGFLFYSEGKLTEAFDLLSRIRQSYAYVNEARALEGIIAQQLLLPADSPLSVKRKTEIYKQAVEDMDKISPPADSTSAKIKEWAQLRIRLCLLHLLKLRFEPNGAAAYDKAQKVADDLIGELTKLSKSLTEEHKLETNLLAQDMRTRAIYLQAAALLEKSNFDGLFAMITPLLDDVDKYGAAATQKMKEADGTEKALEGNLAKLAAGYDSDRRDVVLLALKGHIRKGEVDPAMKQLDRLERLGGSIDTNLSTLQQLVNEVRGQIVALRKDNLNEEAKQLTDGFTQLISKITDKKDVKPTVRLFAGQALLAVDRYAEAAAELAQVPAAPVADLIAPFADLPKDRQDVVRYYRAAVLFRMRALRQAKQFPEADAIVAEVIGVPDKKTNMIDKKGWGFNNTEYKREAFQLAEAKASSLPPGPAATKLWAEAVQGWSGLAGTQRTRLQQSQTKQTEAEKASAANPNDAGLMAAATAAKSDVEKNKASYFEYFFETQRCSILAYQCVYRTDPAKMKQKYDAEAGKIVSLENSNPDLSPDVRTKYADLLHQDDMKELKAAYQAAGGKMFMEKPNLPTPGGQ